MPDNRDEKAEKDEYLVSTDYGTMDMILILAFILAIIGVLIVVFLH